jgi:hypothetical protein
LGWGVADANEQWIAEVNAQSSQYLAYLGLRCIEDLRRLCQTSFVQHQGQDAEMMQADVLIIQHKMYTTPSSRMPRSFVCRMNASFGHYGLMAKSLTDAFTKTSRRARRLMPHSWKSGYELANLGARFSMKAGPSARSCVIG